jgi:TRAP-type mannitol/chloroaromatic compound transport system permease small subunit
VRVDLLYGGASRRRKLWIDVVGLLCFLFPSTLVIGYFAWPFFLASYRSGEVSSNASGLLLWPVKLLLPVGLGLLFLQGLAEAVKRAAALTGAREDAVDYERPLQ